VAAFPALISSNSSARRSAPSASKFFALSVVFAATRFSQLEEEDEGAYRELSPEGRARPQLGGENRAPSSGSASKTNTNCQIKRDGLVLAD
jgi:hypothetical protein